MSEEIKKPKGRPKKEKDYNSPFAARLRELAGDKSNQEIADGVGVSRQTVGQFMLGNTTPDMVTLCKMADYFNVSADYLLCRSDVSSPDINMNASCEYTGLSEEAMKILVSYKEYYDIKDIDYLIQADILLELSNVIENAKYGLDELKEDIDNLEKEIDVKEEKKSSVIDTDYEFDLQEEIDRLKEDLEEAENRKDFLLWRTTKSIEKILKDYYDVKE